jgi:hypothetical protein
MDVIDPFTKKLTTIKNFKGGNDFIYESEEPCYYFQVDDYIIY